ncbi:hypothetical protein BDZ89DRAFT_1047050 [Hymenopellis radicata]|nr:hypothetical protein BDZ89DRAFT_1047050 [Hymenopellis radicata]
MHSCYAHSDCETRSGSHLVVLRDCGLCTAIHGNGHYDHSQGRLLRHDELGGRGREPCRRWRTPRTRASGTEDYHEPWALRTTISIEHRGLPPASSVEEYHDHRRLTTMTRTTTWNTMTLRTRRTITPNKHADFEDEHAAYDDALAGNDTA